MPGLINVWKSYSSERRRTLAIFILVSPKNSADYFTFGSQIWGPIKHSSRPWTSGTFIVGQNSHKIFKSTGTWQGRPRRAWIIQQTALSLFLLSPRQHHSTDKSSIQSLSYSVHDKLQNSSVFFGQDMSFSSISSLCSCFHQLGNVAKLSWDQVHITTDAFISSWLDSTVLHKSSLVVSKPFKMQLHDNSSHITLISYPCTRSQQNSAHILKLCCFLLRPRVVKPLHTSLIYCILPSPEPVSGTRSDRAFKTTEPKLWNSRPLVLHSLMWLYWRPSSSDSLLVSTHLSPVRVSHCDFMLRPGVLLPFVFLLTMCLLLFLFTVKHFVIFVSMKSAI